LAPKKPKFPSFATACLDPSGRGKLPIVCNDIKWLDVQVIDDCPNNQIANKITFGYPHIAGKKPYFKEKTSVES
jgi:hypothetical protein